VKPSETVTTSRQSSARIRGPSVGGRSDALQQQQQLAGSTSLWLAVMM